MSRDLEKIVIVAVAENRVIGKDGEMPWHYPEDMKHFKETTMGHPVVMGRKTYESLPEDYKPLPGRTNIVLSRSGFEPGDEDVEVASSLEEAWEIASLEGDKVFIAGGGAVYEQVLDDADKVVLTRIHDDYDGDSFFPKLGDEWIEDSREDRENLSFIEYVRRRS